MIRAAHISHSAPVLVPWLLRLSRQGSLLWPGFVWAAYLTTTLGIRRQEG
jgi:hypothetical protein